MGTLISDSLLLRHSLHSLSSKLASTKSTRFTHSAYQRCNWKPSPIFFCHSTFASSDPGPSIYGGWEELEYLEEAGESGMLGPFHNFLIYFGIDDRKHAFPFLLGIFAAFAVSRVRLSTIVFLPISLLVFLGGFTIGAVQVGFLAKKLRRNGAALGVFEEKLKHIETLFSDVDGKMSYLRMELERGIDEDELGMGVNETYLRIVEHVRAVIGEAQKTLTDSFSNDLLNLPVDFDFRAKKANQKSSRKRMELRMIGIDLLQFLIGMLREPLIRSKTEKSKDNINEKLGQRLNSLAEKGQFLISDRELVPGNEIGEWNNCPLHNFNSDNSKVEESGIVFDDNLGRIERKVPKNDVITNGARIPNSAKCKFEIDMLGNDMLSFDEENDNQGSSLRFMNSHGRFQKIDFEQNYKRGSFNSYLDPANGNTVQKIKKDNVYLARESESSSLPEQTLDIKKNKSLELNDKQMNWFDFTEANFTSVNHPNQSNQEPVHAKGEGNLPSSSNMSIDGQFEHNIKEASNLLKLAREYMTTQAGEEKADAVLYKAAELLSSAVVMKPMSLIAVGQLGNIYLLHGELKLKITRELRNLLLSSNSLFSGKAGGLRFKKFNNIVASREDIVSVFISVCEECEGLLVEAGRKYRSALSIDRNDVRALYNWGIALCFRAQLIADVGPEAAMDADKVYLAAVDKFNAILSGSKAYAPDALYRWGMILQQRSHLRPKNSREKAVLLHQAKSLFEDVLSMESENKLARDALVSCISELNYNTQL